MVEHLVEYGVGIACFMETKVYEESMATGKWYWLRGTEQLPQLGKAIPERGLGALVDGDRLST